MVAFSVTIAAVVGVLLSALFVLWEVGRYATPQVPVNLFDERREIFAYTVGLFVGIPLVIPWIYFLHDFGIADLLGAFVFLLLLVGFSELAQWALGRSHYWGTGPSYPFYAMGLRCGIAALLITGLAAEYLTVSSVSWEGLTVIGLQSIALLMLEATAALLSLPPNPQIGRTAGGPLSGAIITFVGFFLLGFNAFAGELVGAVAAVIALVGAVYLYVRLRDLFDRIRPQAPPRPGEAIESRFARQDRGGGGTNSP